MSEEESKDRRDERIKLAQRSFDDHRQFLSENNNHMVEMAGLAMKAPALVAAGSIAALLAFYSANWKYLFHFEASISTFNSVLTYLFLSLIFSMIAPCFAYLCTACIGTSGHRASKKRTIMNILIYEQISLQKHIM